MEHAHGTRARRDDFAIGKADPLAVVFIEKLVADGPVFRLIFAPIRVHLSRNVRRKLVGNAFHPSPFVGFSSVAQGADELITRP
jgi:hypothetical protein